LTASGLFRLAAEQGHPAAEYALGHFYEEGLGGFPKDQNEAARCYRLAPDQGDPNAIAKLKGPR